MIIVMRQWYIIWLDYNHSSDVFDVYTYTPPHLYRARLFRVFAYFEDFLCAKYFLFTVMLNGLDILSFLIDFFGYINIFTVLFPKNFFDGLWLRVICSVYTHSYATSGTNRNGFKSVLIYKNYLQLKKMLFHL